MQQLLSPPPIRVASYARQLPHRARRRRHRGDGRLRADPAADARRLLPRALHGAAARAADAAFPHRRDAYNFATISIWIDPSDADGSAAWVRGYSDVMSPSFASGVYANYLAEGEEARVRAAYGPAYPRLVAVKRRYDPENVFRLNQNIDPSGETGTG